MKRIGYFAELATKMTCFYTVFAVFIWAGTTIYHSSSMAGSRHTLVLSNESDQPVTAQAVDCLGNSKIELVGPKSEIVIESNERNPVCEWSVRIEASSNMVNNLNLASTLKRSAVISYRLDQDANEPPRLLGLVEPDLGH